MPAQRLLHPLLVFIATLLVLAPLGLASSAEDLVGTWIGSGKANQGERVELVADGTGSLGATPFEWKVWGTGRVRLEIRGATIRGDYALTGERLDVTIGDVTHSYRREGTGAARSARAATKAPLPKKSVPPKLAGVDEGKVKRFEHPKKYFSGELPAGWSVAEELEDGVMINPGLGPNDTLDAFVLLNYGRLEKDEVGSSPSALLDRNSREFRAALGEQGIRLKRSREKARAVLVKDVPGGVKEWEGTVQSGQRVRVWLGGIVKRDYWLTVGAIVVEGKEERFLPGVKRIFHSIEPRPPKRNPALERVLAGRKVEHNSTNESGSFSVVYTFQADGSVKQVQYFSGAGSDPVDISGSTESWGTFEVIGDTLYMYFQDGQETGEVVVQGGGLVGVRFGGTLYSAR